MRDLLLFVRSTVSNRKGVTAAEYAVLAAGIILAVAAAVTAFGPKLTAKFEAIL